MIDGMESPLLSDKLLAARSYSKTAVGNAETAPVTAVRQRDTASADSGWHGDSPIVLYTGRLERRKGTRYLLEAIPQVVAAFPRVRFRLVGKNTDRDAPGMVSYQAYFKTFASPAAQAATTFVGFVGDNDLEEEYAACDIFVAPSLFESFGLTHLEAMARGKPVVACRVAATPELVVDGETGLLVLPEDSDDLAHAIIRLLRAPNEARRMGEQGQERAFNQFSLDRMVDQTLALYQAARKT